MKYLSRIDAFFFNIRDFYSTALFRSLLGFALFIFYSIRFIDFEWLFTDRGLITNQAARAMFPDLYRPLFFLFPQSESLLFFFHVLLLIGFLMIALGVGGRLMAIGVFLLHTLFLQRNYAVVYGTDFIASVWLFYLCFIRTSDHFSILPITLRRRFRVLPEWVDQWVSSVGFRLLQIHLCIIYFYGGVEKWRGASWWDGSALWKTLSNALYTQYDLSFLSHFAWLIALLTYFAAIWETYFPVVVWSKKWRPLYLALGVGLHGGIALIMGLHFFSLLMVLSYLVFFRTEDLRPQIEKLKFRYSFNASKL